MSKIIEILEELNLCGLSCLEDFMEGEIVTIEIKPEVINEKRCSHDEVKLVKTEYKYLSLSIEEREKLFNGYFHICFHTDVTKTKIQKLNYEDFINQESDFIEVFEEKFSRKSKLLFEEVNDFIINNLDKTDSIKFLLNETLLPKVSSAHIKSISDCSNFKGKAIHSFRLQGCGNFSENEVEIILSYLVRLNDKLDELQGKLKEKFKYYYDKSELKISLDKHTLKMNKDSDERSIHSFFINLNDKEQFLEELRNKFDGQKGIGFKILVKLLEEENVLVIESRGFKIFYNASYKFFLQDIGSYASINDKYKHSVDDQEFYKKDIEAFSKKLKPLLMKYKMNN
jgi:hypothetical protein